MKRALITASVASMIDQFNMPNIRLLLELGYEVDAAANFTDPGSITAERAEALKVCLTDMGVTVTDLPIPRRITALGGIIKSYRVMKRLSRDRKYDLVHCHSPIGGAIARLAVRRERKKGITKSIYTAHGFHFYRGAPKKSWLLFYPIEKLCSRFTDVLITINREDYALAKDKLRAGRVEYIPGVGVDTDRFFQPDVREEKRRELGISKDAALLLSVGELNANKNHAVIIRALAQLERADVHYAIAGRGALGEELSALCRKMGVEDRVHLLGYRDDVAQIYSAADVFVHPSYREGLPVSVMEAMAAGLPIAASRIRGNTDLVDTEGGFLLEPADTDGFARAIDGLLKDRELMKKMGEHNRLASSKYSVSTVKELTEKIYKEI